MAALSHSNLTFASLRETPLGRGDIDQLGVATKVDDGDNAGGLVLEGLGPRSGGRRVAHGPPDIVYEAEVLGHFPAGQTDPDVLSRRLRLCEVGSGGLRVPSAQFRRGDSLQRLRFAALVARRP